MVSMTRCKTKKWIEVHKETICLCLTHSWTMMLTFFKWLVVQKFSSIVQINFFCQTILMKRFFIIQFILTRSGVNKWGLRKDSPMSFESIIARNEINTGLTSSCLIPICWELDTAEYFEFFCVLGQFRVFLFDVVVLGLNKVGLYIFRQSF